jgi:hypothetical protein
MGKINHDDYNSLLVKTKSEAAKLRQMLDRIALDADITPELDGQIEELVTHLRRAPLNQNGNRALLKKIDQNIAQLKNSNGHCTTCHHCNGRVLLSDAFCPSCGLTLSNGSVTVTPSNTCAKCNTPVEPSDAFCAGCGAALDPLHASPFEKALVM